MLGDLGVRGVETWLSDLAKERPNWEFCLLAGRVGELACAVEVRRTPGDALHSRKDFPIVVTLEVCPAIEQALTAEGIETRR